MKDFLLFPLTSSVPLCLHGFHGNRCGAVLILTPLSESMHRTSVERYVI